MERGENNAFRAGMTGSEAGCAGRDRSPADSAQAEAARDDAAQDLAGAALDV